MIHKTDEERGEYNVDTAKIEMVSCVQCHKKVYILNCDGLCENCYTENEKENAKIRAKEKRSTRPKKEIIPSYVRWSVWERDNFTCKNCGNRKHLTVDHIIPESMGGQITLDNCQTLCKSCNSRKGTK